MGQGATSFESSRLTPALGAEIRGLDLSAELDEATTDSLYDALLEHHVLVLRGGPLPPARLVALGSVCHSALSGGLPGPVSSIVTDGYPSTFG